MILALNSAYVMTSHSLVALKLAILNAFFSMLTSTFALNIASHSSTLVSNLLAIVARVFDYEARRRAKRRMINWTSTYTFHQIMFPFQYNSCHMSINWFELCQNLITLQNNLFSLFSLVLYVFNSFNVSCSLSFKLSTWKIKSWNYYNL